MTSIIIAASVVGVTGIIIGIFLGVSGEKFKVEVDEKEIRVREALPGNNCGGCGYAGCDALAKAIAKGEAPVTACSAGGASTSEKVAAVMGVEAGETVKLAAFVKCAGTCDKASIKYNYYGNNDCRKLALIPGGGDKACQYGCLGYGSCVSVCKFDAIHIVDGVAKVDRDKCTACGQCVNVCPKHIIELVPYENSYAVSCSSKDKGKDVKAVCQTGCIGCSLCTRVCKSEAITIENNLAHIDYSKCTGCGECAAKCPSKIIKMIKSNV